jgi:hypothetical protein
LRSVAATCAGVAEPAATVVDATPMAWCKLALTSDSRGSVLVAVVAPRLGELAESYRNFYAAQRFPGRK